MNGETGESRIIPETTYIFGECYPINGIVFIKFRSSREFVKVERLGSPFIARAIIRVFFSIHLL